MRRPRTYDASPATDTTPWLVVTAILVTALSFRAPFLAVGPIADDVSDGLGLGAAQIGLLTTIPVLCFGLSAPWAAAVSRRTGFDRALLVALAMIVAGVAVRSMGSWTAALVGSVVIGLGITIGNIVVPAILRRVLARRHQTVVTSGYTGAMNVGATAATLGIVPLAGLTGWRWALAAWALVAAAAMVLWAIVAIRGAPALPRTGADPTTEGSPPAVPVRRTALGWLLALAFAGQVSAYYSVAAWLPQILRDDTGLSAARAAAATSWFQVLAIAGALLLTAALRTVSWTSASVAMGVLWLACPVILLLAQDLYLVATTLGGLAQGAGLTALFVLIMQRSDSDRQAAEYSAFVQGIGYMLSAIAPFAVGGLHEATGGWTGPLLLVVAYLVVFTGAQCAAVRRPEPTAR